MGWQPCTLYWETIAFIMKILIINTVPTDKNGITNVIFNYLSAMDKKLGVIDLVSLNVPSEMYQKSIEQFGGQVYVLPRSAMKVISYWNRLRKLIRENRYDAVHIHGNSHTVTLELSAAKAAGCVVRMVHAHNTTCSHVVVHKLLTPLFNALCTYGLACGEAAGHFMFGKRDFTVMNNGVDTEKFAFNLDNRTSIRESLGWVDNPIVGHVGYFTEVKNQNFIVDVFLALHKHNPDYRMILIGDGPLKPIVEQKIGSLGLDGAVCLTGNIDNVNEYLSAIDFIVMPSLFEGLPLTLVEQQANGLQCFVSDAITRETDKTGNLIFIPLKASPESWGEKIENSDDGCTREVRSKRAIASIRDAGYDIKYQAKMLESFYKNTL